MREKTRILTSKRIGIFGKGGSGKSTVVVLLAKALCDYGFPVCVLDADSTNVGLPQALGIDSPPKALLELFGGMVFSGGTVTCPVDDPTPLPGAEIFLEKLSSQYYGYSEEGIRLLIAGKIGNLGPGAGCDGPISKIARDLVLRDRHQDPVLLVDFKAGFEDSARGAVTSLDWAIVIVDPTSASIEMAANMRDMVREIKADTLPATAHLENPFLVALANRIFTDAVINDIFFILNKVPNAETETYLRVKLLEKGIQPLGCIREDPTIAVAWLKGLPVRANVVSGEVQIILERLMESVDGNSRNPSVFTE